MNIVNTILNLLPQLAAKLASASETKTNYWNSANAEEGSKQLSHAYCAGLARLHEHSGRWQMPVSDDTITSPYGWRTLQGNRHFHAGVDYTGYNIYGTAPTDCVIKKVLQPDYEYPCRFRYNPATGKFEDALVPKGRAWTPYVVALCAHDTNVRFVYRHGNSLRNTGEYVKAGDAVVAIGNYGYSMGAHLHFEVQLLGADGKWHTTDPHKYLQTQIARQTMSKKESA